MLIYRAFNFRFGRMRWSCPTKTSNLHVTFFFLLSPLPTTWLKWLAESKKKRTLQWNSTAHAIESDEKFRLLRQPPPLFFVFQKPLRNGQSLTSHVYSTIDWVSATWLHTEEIKQTERLGFAYLNVFYKQGASQFSSLGKILPYSFLFYQRSDRQTYVRPCHRQ